MTRWKIFISVLILLTTLSLTGSLTKTSAQPPAHQLITLQHDGVERSFFVHVPPGTADSYPLLIALHPYSSSGLAMAALTGFDAIADAEGFIVAYPNSADDNWGEDTTLETNPDDVGFIEAVIDTMVAEFDVDAGQVYLTGFHNGGLMAYRLACEVPERFKSVAVVGPLMFGYQRDACPATASAPVDMLIIRGTNDPLYQADTYTYQPIYNNTKQYLILGVDDTLAFWTGRNGCDLESVSTVNDLANTRLYDACEGDTRVALYSIEGGKENWPRKGDYILNPFGIDASDMVIDFFNGGDSWASPHLTLDEEARTSVFYVPSSYDPAEPMPLVIVLHGRFGSGAGTADYTGMNRVAEAQGFIALYPDGLPNYGAITPFDTGWNYLRGIPGAGDEGSDDAAFLRDLIADLSLDLAIDQARVYVIGVSNGGFMVHNLACGDPERYAAFADVIGSASYGFDRMCDHEIPVSMLMMHGTADDNILWDGRTQNVDGQDVMVSYPILNVIEYWAGHNRCNTDLAELTDLPPKGESPGTSVRIMTMNQCELDANVMLVGILGGGHVWPGIAEDVNDATERKINMDINAGEVIWHFFVQHTRPQHNEP